MLSTFSEGKALKRIIKTAALLLAAVLTAAAFISCGPRITGSYNVFTINALTPELYFTGEAEANGFTLEELIAAFAAPGFSGNTEEYMTVRLDDDGAAAVAVFGLERRGSYVFDGSNVTISLENGETMVLEYVRSIAKLRYVQDEKTEIIFRRAE